MSVEAVSWAINKAPCEGNVSARMVLVHLADHADSDGRNTWKYVSTIADEMRVSDSTVRRQLKWLEDRGLIERGDQHLVDHYDLYQRPVVWNLRLDLVQKPTERQLARRRPGRPRKRRQPAGIQKNPCQIARGSHPRQGPPRTDARSPLARVTHITSIHIPITVTPLPLRGISPWTGRPRETSTPRIRPHRRTGAPAKGYAT